MAAYAFVMGMVGSVAPVIAALAGVVGTFFAWVGVRHQLRRPKRRVPPLPSPGDGRDGGYDAFIAYAEEDTAWVAGFIQRLQAKGVKLAYDKVVLQPSRKITHTLEQAVLESTHGIIVFGKASRSPHWVEAMYETLMRRSIEQDRKFVPVLIADVQLREFANNHVPADFRGLVEDEPRYDHLVDLVAQAVRRGGTPQASAS